MIEKIAVLVVEDEPLILMDIADQLADEDFQVFEAANAKEAIALLEAQPSIRILFTDVDMPGGMDGLKLAAAVHGRWPPVKIVVTSGRRLVEITDIPDGSMFYAKPYRHDAIIAAFREMLG